jgi:hypothetical protein
MPPNAGTKVKSYEFMKKGPNKAGLLSAESYPWSASEGGITTYSTLTRAKFDKLLDENDKLKSDLLHLQSQIDETKYLQKQEQNPFESQPGSVIFLDIDGVLHSVYTRDYFTESCAVAFEQIVRDTGAAIVLSSTWRTRPDWFDEANDFLKQRGLPVILDSTRDLSRETKTWTKREVEICEWLDRHPEVTSWIAIDDENLTYSDSEQARRMRGHFVHTKSDKGLQPHDVDLALRLMSAQRRQL